MTPAHDAFHVAYVAVRQAAMYSPEWNDNDCPTEIEMKAMAWALRLLADRCQRWSFDTEVCHQWTCLAVRAHNLEEAYAQAYERQKQEELDEILYEQREEIV